MPRDPHLEDFREQVQRLARSRLLTGHVKGGEIDFKSMTLDEVDKLIAKEAGYYFLIAAAGLNRTSLRREMARSEVKIEQKKKRKARAIQRNLPLHASFDAVADKAVALRARDLNRRARGEVEARFRERLKEEGIPVFMSPPVRTVPGLLVSGRKPDGVYPDPATGRAPLIYLEIKNINRVRDDIQKRLYEIAEASMEMKSIYGRLRLKGLNLSRTEGVADNAALRGKIREQVVASHPVIVALFICPIKEAERYRAGAETYIDRVFFQEEVEDCIAFLRETVEAFEPR